VWAVVSDPDKLLQPDVRNYLEEFVAASRFSSVSPDDLGETTTVGQKIEALCFWKQIELMMLLEDVYLCA
jgi:hypothetical protein